MVLVQKDFNIKNEFMVMDKVNKEIEKTILHKWSDYFSKMSWLVIVPFIIQPTPVIFTALIIVIAVLLLYLLLKYIKAYSIVADEEEYKINALFVISNFIVSIVLGIISYNLVEFKLVSFIAIYSAFLAKFVEDKKYALFVKHKLKIN